MSKKDVNRYYMEVQNQYVEMLADLKDLNEAVKAGLLPQERVEQAKAQIETITTNYKRLSYIMFLLDLPVKKEKRNKHILNEKLLIKYLDGHSDYAVIGESFNCLKSIKELSKEVKNER